MKKVTIMCRVSSDEQAKGYSLDDQLERLTNYCERNDYEIVHIIREDHSAKSFERPDWKKWIELVKGRKLQADEIIFTSWDRFSRDLVGAFNMIKYLRGVGITPQSVEQPINYDIPKNLFMLAIYLANPDVDNQRRSIKVKGGIRQGLKQGRWTYKALLGYKTVRDESKKSMIVPNSETAWIIQYIFEHVSKGVSQKEIRLELEKKGADVSRNNMCKILRREVYMGKIVIPANEEEPQRMIEGVHEPLVSESLFYSVQSLLDENKKYRGGVPKYTKMRDDFHLRGVLTCNSCDEIMTASASRGRLGKRYGYYHCNHCKGQRESVSKVHEAFEKLLESLKIEQDVKQLYLLILSEQLGTSEKENKQKVNNLQTQLNQLNERIERMQDLMLDGKLDADEYVSIKTRYSAQIEGIKQKIKSFGAKNSEVKKLAESSLNLFANLPKAFANADVRLKQKIVGSIFPKLISFDGMNCRTPILNPVLDLFSSI
ncbi:MAG: recombinase family protein, partial [Crocinitomicaceae bacterium]|nr:recombinase family protein [Crocinitomicaceae bacterium]